MRSCLEIAALQVHGVERIYHPNDGMALGLVGMIDDHVARAKALREERPRTLLRTTASRSRGCESPATRGFYVG